MASKRIQGGGWTEWIQDQTSNQYYRMRQNYTGDWEYQWYQDTPQQDAPRGDNVEHLTDTLAAATIGDTTYTHPDPQHSNYSYTSTPVPGNVMTSTAPSGPSAYQPQAYHGSTYQSPSASPDKGKGIDYNQPRTRPRGRGPAGRKPKGKHARGYSEDYDNEPAGDPNSELSPFYEITDSDSVSGDHQDPAQDFEHQTDAATKYEPGYAQADLASPHVDDEVDLSTTHHESQGQYYQEAEVDPEVGVAGADTDSDYQPGQDELDPNGYPVDKEHLDFQNSADASYNEEEELDELGDGFETGMAGSSSSMGPAEPGYEGQGAYSYQYDTGQRTPRARSPQMAGYPYGGNTMDQTINEAHYGASRTHDDGMLERYIVEPSSRFQPGSVFKIWWSEPLGDGGNPTIRSYQNKKGEKFHYSFRRFIVVASDEGHSTCVPILTYGHRACTKRGVKPQKHGIVFQSGQRPFRLSNEPELGFPPARVELSERTEKLDKESRVNYSKLVTIEHNYRVFFIGRINPRDFAEIVSPAVDTCWGKKKRHHHR